MEEEAGQHQGNCIYRRCNALWGEFCKTGQVFTPRCGQGSVFSEVRRTFFTANLYAIVLRSTPAWHRVIFEGKNHVMNDDSSAMN